MPGTRGTLTRFAAQRHYTVALLLAAAAMCLHPGRARAFSVVALDAGHSIKSQGAISARGTPEFEFNRKLVLVLNTELTNAAIRTVPIAVDGNTEDLISRPRKALEMGAQLFISVHHDSAKARFQQRWQFEGKSRKFLDDRFRGFSLFVSRHNPHWPLALKCASAIGARLIEKGFRPSRYHADPVLGSSREFADEINGVHFYDNLAVLRHAAMPALLMEAGVIVNRDEEALLVQPGAQQRMAAAVVSAIADCKG